MVKLLLKKKLEKLGLLTLINFLKLILDSGLLPTLPPPRAEVCKPILEDTSSRKKDENKIELEVQVQPPFEGSKIHH